MAKETQKRKRPIVLIVLDGWGIAPKRNGNAISLAVTPTIDYFYEKYPNVTLEASGEAVGLPKNQVGNSETGHMNIGAGRVVKQDIEDILEQVENGKFFNNQVLIDAAAEVKKRKGAKIHVMGLLTGKQSSHSYPDFLYALLDLLNRQKVKNVYLHLFSDGRDSGQYDGVKQIEKLMRNFKNGEIVSTVCGRFYAMDRADNWGRTKDTYELLTQGKGEFEAHDPIAAFTDNYNRGTNDEFIPPTVVNNPKLKPAFIESGDVVIFFNNRSDRARQLVKPFIQKDFEKQGGFKRKKRLKDLHFVTFTDFAEDLDHSHNAFPEEILENTLVCALADAGLSQVYIAEEEKFAHMTYFINGGVGHTRCGEDRIQFPSYKVRNFDKKPEMSTPKIADRIAELIRHNKYDFYATNLANADMLGHTGNFEATIKGVNVIDKALKNIYYEVKKRDGIMFITSDHGNAEKMIDNNGNIETQHNDSPVPFFIVGNEFKGKHLNFRKGGKLANIAPTILDIIGADKPVEMTARSLIVKKSKRK